MTISRQHWYTIEEYHKIEEENPDCKFEYIDGEVRIMAGGTYEHMKIAVNLVTILNIHLEDSVCQVVNSDIHVLPTGRDNPSYLPDVTVTCNPEDYHPDAKAIRFPSLIIEVLSQSTELIDRNEKLRAYHTCPSMQEYLIASTQRREIEAYRRREDGEWHKTVYRAEDTIPLVTIGLNIPMNTIYRRTGID
jgi:Uma2 family endonuclease